MNNILKAAQNNGVVTAPVPKWSHIRIMRETLRDYEVTSNWQPAQIREPNFFTIPIDSDDISWVFEAISMKLTIHYDCEYYVQGEWSFILKEDCSIFDKLLNGFLQTELQLIAELRFNREEAERKKNRINEILAELFTN